jgi:ABC-type uncharacterized transport system auxiliary subunit
MVRQWSLEYEPPATREGFEPLADQTISLKRFTASMDYITEDMVYRPDDYERGVYPYNRWRVRPAEMVGDMLLRDIKAAGLFKAVFGPERADDARFVLEGGVLRFLEVDAKDNWRAELELSLTLLDKREKHLPQRILFQRQYQAKTLIQEKGAAGLARAMSLAMNEISGKVVNDLKAACEKAVLKKLEN